MVKQRKSLGSDILQSPGTVVDVPELAASPTKKVKTNGRLDDVDVEDNGSGSLMNGLRDGAKGKSRSLLLWDS